MNPRIRCIPAVILVMLVAVTLVSDNVVHGAYTSSILLAGVKAKYRF